MNKQVIINELHRKMEELKLNPDVSPVDVVNDILDFVNKCPDDGRWIPRKEHTDTLFKIYNTRKLDRDDKLVVLDIYNTFLELLGTPRI